MSIALAARVRIELLAEERDLSAGREQEQQVRLPAARLALVIVTYVPALSLWLPSLLKF